MFDNSDRVEESESGILYWDTQYTPSTDVKRILRQIQQEYDVGVIDKRHNINTFIEIQRLSNNLQYRVDVTNRREIEKYRNDLEQELDDVKDDRIREELLLELGRVNRLNQVHSETISELAKTDPEVIVMALQTGYIILDSANILSDMGIRSKVHHAVDTVNRVGKYISEKGEEVVTSDEVDKKTRKELEDTIQSSIDDW